MCFVYRLTPEQEIKFIEMTIDWRHELWSNGKKFPMEDCIFYNFGYEKEFPYPQVSLRPEDDVDITLTSHGMNAPNLCSIILIAGEFILTLFLPANSRL